MVDVFTPAAACQASETAAEIFARRLAERGLRVGEGGYPVRFTVSAGMGAEDFAIRGREGGAEILSGGVLGLIHGAGFFLRHTEFAPGGADPCPWRGEQRPKCAIRGVYFASHFHNYYHVASTEELRRYIEDLALWGFNCIKAIYPLIDLAGPDDPECGVHVERLKTLFSLAHALGMKAATSLNTNSAYREFPSEYLFTPHPDPTGRRGNSGNMMCPSVPGAEELAMRINEELLRRLQPAAPDLVMTWPYDEGGCACEQCRPWGGNGFIRCSKRAFEIARALLPGVTRCVSTWCFDTPEEGEWEALCQSLQAERWCDVILADAHEDFPRYPLERGVPGGLPLINFPEISMWGLYPWGGWGATMLPERFTALWGQAGRLLQGGFVYSEGIYEDINKAVVSQLYWHGGADWRDTLGQYARYELGMNDAGAFLELVSLVERTHTDVAVTGRCDTAAADRAHALARRLDGALPPWAKGAWRWRIILLRTALDSRRYRLAEASGAQGGWMHLNWKAMLKEDGASQAAFREIISLFHCMERDTGDMYHCRVRPACD